MQKSYGTHSLLEKGVICMASVIAKSRMRLTTPLIKVNGELQPVSWDEALIRARDLIQPILEESGGDSLAVFSCSKSTNELNYLASKFARSVFGTNNVDSCNRT